MPHLRITTSPGLAFVDASRLFDSLHAALMASGEFAAEDIKLSWLPLAQARAGLGGEFAHAELRLLAGRAESVRAAIARSVVDVLCANLGSATADAQISCETVEIHRASYAKRSRRQGQAGGPPDP